jgi:hypothetical protein
MGRMGREWGEVRERGRERVGVWARNGPAEGGVFPFLFLFLIFYFYFSFLFLLSPFFE